MTDVILRIDGDVVSPVDLHWKDFCRITGDDRIADVGTLSSRRRGSAVRLSAVLNRVEPLPTASHITLHASADGFTANLSVDAVRAEAVLIDSLEGAPLAHQDGGPIRFLIPDAAPCKTAELDACANVKHVDRIEFTSGPAIDSRDSDQ